MNGLALHAGASAATLEEVRAVATPEPTESHFPIPHDLILSAVEAHAAGAGMEISERAYGLTRDGARFFGLLKLAGASPSGDFGLVIGVRNAHDRSYAAALAVGSSVFVCDNLAFSGEILIGRKHTRHIARDLPLLIPRAFAALSVERVNMERRIEAYKGAGLDDKGAHDLTVRACVHEGIFPARSLPDVVAQWRAPAHEEFKPRTVWSLFNGFTEAAKAGAGNLPTLERRTRLLHGFFDRELGLSLATRDEVLAAGDGEALVGAAALARN